MSVWMQRLRSLLAGVLLAMALAACSRGGGGNDQGAPACAIEAQKQAILDIMLEWYFFNDEPEQQQKYAGLDVDGFATAEALLAFLRFRPEEFDRNFTFQTTTAADQQFFGEGQFIGFGFGTKFVDSPANTDLRFTQVFSGSPAENAGIRRGFRLLAVDGRGVAEINQAEGLSAALGPAVAGVARTLRVADPGGGEFETTLTKALITLDPVPFSAVFDVNGTPVGYLDMRTFVTTADSELEDVFAGFEAQAVAGLVIDLRYNGGGVVATAELLADLVGGFIADGRVASETRYNSAKSAFNTLDTFQRRAGSLSLLQQVVFVTTASSASASELLINSLRPHTVVTVVGADTFGKPVGQSGFTYCNDERLLRPVTFETVNALGEGRFFDGLRADCPASDDLTHGLGDPAEESLATALGVIETGACPVPPGSAKPRPPGVGASEVPLSADAPAAQRYLGAF